MNLNKSVVLLGVLVFVGACSSEIASNQQLAPVNLPDPTSVGASIMEKYCTNCHGAPHPSVHEKEQWYNVVYRMNERRIKRALGEIPEEKFKTLVEYLERHAGKP